MGADASTRETRRQRRSDQYGPLRVHRRVDLGRIRSRFDSASRSLSGILCVGHNMRSVHAPKTETVHV